jgi:hypothetical protein
LLDLIERKTHDEEQHRREERLRTLTQLLIDVPWQARSDGASPDGRNRSRRIQR